jgi:hypothetical protein
MLRKSVLDVSSETCQAMRGATGAPRNATEKGVEFVEYQRSTVSACSDFSVLAADDSRDHIQNGARTTASPVRPPPVEAA